MNARQTTAIIPRAHAREETFHMKELLPDESAELCTRGGSQVRSDMPQTHRPAPFQGCASVESIRRSGGAEGAARAGGRRGRGGNRHLGRERLAERETPPKARAPW